jgi:hypothetical protein
MTITLNAAQAIIERARARHQYRRADEHRGRRRWTASLASRIRGEGMSDGQLRQLKARWSGASAEANDCECLRP